jgi:hypothetical protein
MRTIKGREFAQVATAWLTKRPTSKACAESRERVAGAA